MKMSRLGSEGAPCRAPSLVSTAPAVLQALPSESLVTAFGEKASRDLTSSSWQERASALEHARDLLVPTHKRRTSQQPASLWQPTCSVLQSAIEDKTMPVVLEAAKLLGALLAAGSDFLQNNTVAADQMLAVLPGVYLQSISSKPRISAAGLQCLLLMAHSSPAGAHAVLNTVLEPNEPKAKGTDVVHQQRLRTANSVLVCCGHHRGGALWLQRPAAAESQLMSLIGNSLTAADDKVRALALDLATELHILKQVLDNPAPLDTALLDDAIKPAVLATLQARLSEADFLAPDRAAPIVRTRINRANTLMEAARRLPDPPAAALDAGRPTSVPNETSTSYTPPQPVCVRAISADHMTPGPSTSRAPSALRRAATGTEGLGEEGAGGVAHGFGPERLFVRVATLDETDERLLDWIDGEL